VKHHSRLDDFDIRELHAAHEAGETIQSIGNRIGYLDMKRIARAMRALGLHVRTAREAFDTRRGFNDDAIPGLYRCYDEGEPIVSIASRLELSVQTLYNVFRRHGFPMPTYEGPLELNCGFCGVPYLVRRSNPNSHFCSKKCFDDSRRGKPLPGPHLSSAEKSRRAVENARKWAAANPEKALRNRRKWVDLHREQVNTANCERSRRYRQDEAKRAELNERTRQWRAAHPEYKEEHSEQLTKYQREYREKNRTHITEYQRGWSQRERAAKPEITRVRNHVLRARIAAAPGTHTIEDIKALLEVQHGKCAGCAIRLFKTGKNRYHVDHIVPLKPRRPGDAPGSDGPENLQALCPTCNLKKSNMPPEQWAAQIGKLFV
jgi:5-methylcytosine-specific restriction endonuclease McrA